MAKLPPPVARLRVAVRDALADLPTGSLALAACSGGPDSLALADTLAFCAPRMGLRAGLVTVDHGLQAGSHERAAEVVAWARSAGLEPALSIAVEVGAAGGPEGAARTARYAALDDAAQEHGAGAVLLGHTRDDQAETVLLALARGGGPRGIAGMRAVRGIYRRPLLGIARTDTHAACAERGLKPWTDPHNTDPRFLRSALRPAMDVLVATLGEDVVANLAQTAALVGADTDYLDRLAGEALEACRADDGAAPDALNGVTAGGDADAESIADGGGSTGALDAKRVAALAGPVRQRALRAWVLEAGVEGAELNHRHLDAVDALVVYWHGQGPTFLPGGIEVRRSSGRLTARRGDPPSRGV
ncbi:tRNA lysidine(34) synthetase TilS [Glycomyces algeriensis]|uniref:tRNA(Ile)-lysidine synthase n=1 Tax=Glycomyces algeriensis TaxID=256037 RepID=A0A9W6G5Q8_9ACTN|nr:tRNA lysidine(34) synthetase TilS [Glycomyces algeriensis]MDA1368109.1 tRNA lysidine(34) synthetase TilS [Glycomyces algeriensis]MDR7348910.1 tRNA(Ile)-lysidine synthase [Glycomyces algeriensis]GLI41614.1 tRNA(Ile)-lysidine synthase [Glycomyces algeriensis]